MDTERRFLPPRARGLFFQGVAAALSGAGGFWLLNLAAVAPVGPALAAELIGGIVLTAWMAVFLYGFYALQRSHYLLHRDGLRLRWGWREIHLPMPEVIGAYLGEALDRPIPLPWIRWPGWILGRRSTPWGTVEFLASDPRRLVLIETTRGWFALSPEDPLRFLEALRRAAEEGSLNPIAPYERHPLDLFGELRLDRWAQGLLLTAWGSALALLVLSLLFPGRTLGYGAVSRWLLLPVVNFLFLGMGLGMGLFAYRSPRRRALAYPLWLSNAVASLSLLGYVVFSLIFT